MPFKVTIKIRKTLIGKTIILIKGYPGKYILVSEKSTRKLEQQKQCLF